MTALLENRTGDTRQLWARDTRLPADAPLVYLAAGEAEVLRADARAGNLPNLRRTRFGSIRLDLERLTDWSEPPSMDRKVTPTDDGRFHTTLQYTQPPDVEAQLAGVRLKLGYAFWSRGNLRSEASFSARAGLALNAPDGFPYEDWVSRYVRPLRNFLTLATQRPVSIVELVVRQPVGSDASGERELEAVWRRDPPDPDARLLLPPELLLVRSDLPDFAESISRWLTASEHSTQWWTSSSARITPRPCTRRTASSTLLTLRRFTTDADSVARRWKKRHTRLALATYLTVRRFTGIGLPRSSSTVTSRHCDSGFASSSTSIVT